MCQTQPLLVALGLLGAGAMIVGLLEVRFRLDAPEGAGWTAVIRTAQLVFAIGFVVRALQTAFDGC